MPKVKKNYYESDSEDEAPKAKRKTKKKKKVVCVYLFQDELIVNRPPFQSTFFRLFYGSIA